MGGLAKLFAPKPPEIKKPDPIVQPDPETQKLAAAKRVRDRAQKGREGTIFSTNYGGANLGGTA